MSAIEVVGDSRPAAYLEGDTIVLRASSFGSACIRDLVLHLVGDHTPLPTPDTLQARFDAGHAAEPHILDRLRALGWESQPDAAQHEGELRIFPNLIIRFHPDEVMRVASTGDVRLVECKALAESSHDQAQRKGTGSLFSYDWQLSIMMLALKLPAVWVGLRKKPDGEEEDWSGELHLEFVDTPPRSKVEIVKRAKEIRDAYLHAAETGELPDCEGDRYPCPFLFLRPEREDTTVEAEGDEADQIDHWGLIYAKAHEEEKAAGDLKKEAREKLIEIAGNRLGVRGSRFRFTRAKVTRTSYDTSAMERDGIELGKYKRVTESERVAVQEVG